MLLRNTTTKWGSITKTLHWVTALAVIGMLAVGFYMANLDPSQIHMRARLYGLHKSLGFTILIVTLMRLLWRWVNPVPVYLATFPTWERITALVTHYLLYILLLVIPSVGLGMVLLSPRQIPVSIFGLFVVPNPFSPYKELSNFLRESHEVLAIVLIVVSVLHMGAALWHHFVRKNDVLKRMLPWDTD